LGGGVDPVDITFHHKDPKSTSLRENTVNTHFGILIVRIGQSWRSMRVEVTKGNR